MIAIVNYGLGNVRAFLNIYRRLNIPATIGTSAEELNKSDKIILPGVGSFDWALKRLNESGMRDALEHSVMTMGKPVLGICVGMQMMADGSDEGVCSGLGWISADVKRFDISNSSHNAYLPHMGWNDVKACADAELYRGLEEDARFYFLHSYYFMPHNAECILAETNYHGEFASSVRLDNIYGVQFHPEKSHQWGIRLLKNFAEL